jgi:hypothetical protein
VPWLGCEFGAARRLSSLMTLTTLSSLDSERLRVIRVRRFFSIKSGHLQVCLLDRHGYASGVGRRGTWRIMAACQKFSPQVAEAKLEASYQNDHGACDCLHMSRPTPSAPDFLNFEASGPERPTCLRCDMLHGA